jgi:hypothetical protein
MLSTSQRKNRSNFQGKETKGNSSTKTNIKKSNIRRSTKTLEAMKMTGTVKRIRRTTSKDSMSRDSLIDQITARSSSISQAMVRDNSTGQISTRENPSMMPDSTKKNREMNGRSKGRKSHILRRRKEAKLSSQSGSQKQTQPSNPKGLRRISINRTNRQHSQLRGLRVERLLR